MIDCRNNQDILIDYLNNRLPQEDKFKVVAHLADCEDCRKEMAFLINLKNKQMHNLKEVPESVELSAFNLIPEVKPESRSLLHLDQVYDSLALVGHTVRFVFQII